MNKSYIIILFVLLLNSCKTIPKGNESLLNVAEHNLTGIGLIEIAIDKPIRIYKNTTDKKHFDRITFKSIKKGKEKGSFLFESSHLNTLFQPYLFDEGFSDERRNDINRYEVFNPRVVLRVIERTENNFTVVLNEDTKQIGVLKINDFTDKFSIYEKQYRHENPDLNINKIHLFEAWDIYLKRCQFIYTRTPDIYDKPNGKIIYDKSNKYKRTQLQCKAIEIQGEWMKVNTNLVIRPEDLVGDRWIKWRDSNSILIDIFEQTYL